MKNKIDREWWSKKATAEQKENYVKQLENLVEGGEIDIDEDQNNVEIAKKIIPLFKANDKRWVKFPMEEFDYN